MALSVRDAGEGDQQGYSNGYCRPHPQWFVNVTVPEINC